MENYKKIKLLGKGDCWIVWSCIKNDNSCLEEKKIKMELTKKIIF